LARTNHEEGARPLPFARHGLPFRLRLSLPSTTAALNRGVVRVRRLANRCGCSKDDQADLEIALREALANAIRHGNGARARSRVFLRAYCGPDAGIFILVRDEGPGFDPDQVPDPREEGRKELDHGRGLLLMREMMDRVVFRRGGREVLLYREPFAR
jgi:serine/threonine-protein kinase RsbW